MHEKNTRWIHACYVCGSDDNSETCELGQLEDAGKRFSAENCFDTAVQHLILAERRDGSRSGDRVVAHEKCRKCSECEKRFSSKRKAKAFSEESSRFICHECANL